MVLNRTAMAGFETLVQTAGTYTTLYRCESDIHHIVPPPHPHVPRRDSAPLVVFLSLRFEVTVFILNAPIQ